MLQTKATKQVIMSNELTIKIFVGLLMGGITSYLAYRRGKQPIIWFFIGALLGVLGLLLLFFFPNPQSDRKKMPITIAIEKDPPFVLQSWYYLDKDHKQYGPVSFSYLKGLWSQEKLQSGSLVWQEEMTHWKKLDDLPEMLSYLKSN